MIVLTGLNFTGNMGGNASAKKHEVALFDSINYVKVVLRRAL